MAHHPPHLHGLTIVQNNLVFLLWRARVRVGDVSLHQIAAAARVSHTTIKRWEAGKWGEKAPQIIAAYVALIPDLDEGAIWHEAAANWHRPLPGSLLSGAGRAAGQVRRRRHKRRTGSP